MPSRDCGSLQHLPGPRFVPNGISTIEYKTDSSREPSQLKAISDGACPSLLEAIGREGFLEDDNIPLDYFGRILETLLAHGMHLSPSPASNSR